MKLTFEDNNIKSEIKDIVEDIIKNCPNGAMHKGITVVKLADDEAELYEDSEDFVKNHIDSCTLYMVYQSVAGAWNQPLTMVAVGTYVTREL